MKVPTEQQIRAMTPDQRASLLVNAQRIGGELGGATVALLERLGLPFLSGGLTHDHPLYVEMNDLIQSPEGKAAALRAVENGLPAMAGIDPLLQQHMGSRYSNEQMMTVSAGFLTGNLMIGLGYEKNREGVPLPDGCVARSSTTWKLKKRLR